MSGTGTSFTRNMMTLLGGTATAQVIPWLAAPVLTRLYTPEQFGALAIAGVSDTLWSPPKRGDLWW